MCGVDRILTNNAQWAEQVKLEDPEFFERHSEEQSPTYLWIGCSDSRVSVSQITGLAPGEVFVHRNIANQVIHTDINCLSVLHFAIKVLKVRHVIVCGHYNCGGVQAAFTQNDNSFIGNWLRHIQDVYRFNAAELDSITDEHERLSRFCELNVIEQVASVCDTPVVRQVWKQGQDLSIHGWIYDLKDGLLRNLGVSVNGPGESPLA